MCVFVRLLFALFFSCLFVVIFSKKVLWSNDEKQYNIYK